MRGGPVNPALVNNVPAGPFCPAYVAVVLDVEVITIRRPAYGPCSLRPPAFLSAAWQAPISPFRLDAERAAEALNVCTRTDRKQRDHSREKRELSVSMPAGSCACICLAVGQSRNPARSITCISTSAAVLSSMNISSSTGPPIRSPPRIMVRCMGTMRA